MSDNEDRGIRVTRNRHRDKQSADKAKDNEEAKSNNVTYDQHKEVKSKYYHNLLNMKSREITTEASSDFTHDEKSIDQLKAQNKQKKSMIKKPRKTKDFTKSKKTTTKKKKKERNCYSDKENLSPTKAVKALPKRENASKEKEEKTDTKLEKNRKLFEERLSCMSASTEEKPQYFANGDFEKTVADIIASPRRAAYQHGAAAGASSSQTSIFDITEKQREYYVKCFKHLLKTTRSSNNLSDALNGADSRVVDFFQRSGLDTDSLSRIWALADVNEDGWLEIDEFSIAMHLIVLRVKGEVPIPNQLPAHIRPPVTPARSSSQMLGQLSPAVIPSSGPSSASAAMKEWGDFISTDSKEKEPEVPLATFSDVPPLLVDSRPTAVKQPIPQLLSLKSPSGPPPAPPPRPQQKGHTRSASLDLKMINQQQGLSVCPVRRESDSSTTATSRLASSLLSTVTAPVPPLHLSGPVPVETNLVPLPTALSLPPQPLMGPPPVPMRVSPPAPLPARKKTVETQTDYKAEVDTEKILKEFIDNFGNKLEDLLAGESEAVEGKGVERWALRCESLRKQNAELEAERARLAQVRIQLELRLQEMEESKTRSTSGGGKPTAL